MPEGLGRGYFFGRGLVPPEPEIKRTIAFVDGQNLYHSVREAFGRPYPDYDIAALSGRVCFDHGWNLTQTRFYTGVPDAADNAFWHQFWSAKLAAMGRQGVYVYSRSLRYHNRAVILPNGSTHTFLAGQEKGIDVRIALDVIRLAHRNDYDVAVIFSQDQDLTEVAQEIRVIAQEQNRWIKVACAFPSSPTLGNRRGINGTDWVRIDRATYESCLDARDYRSGV